MTREAFDLERFVAAQEGTYPAALAELRAGAKRTHWMWFIFRRSRASAIRRRPDFMHCPGLGEARAYVEHPLLGRRILECTEAVNGVRGATLLRSSAGRTI